MQLSDRFVTTERGGLHDRLANKTVLVCTTDAAVSLSYTGFAFIQGIPTDQWLVEKLTGSAFPRGETPVMLGSSNQNGTSRLGQMLRRLVRNIDEVHSSIQPVFRATWHSMPFAIVVAGWQWKPPLSTQDVARGQYFQIRFSPPSERSIVELPLRYRPLVCGIAKSAGAHRATLEYRERNWYLDGKCTFAAVPKGQVSPDKLSDLKTALAQAPSIDAYEGALVELMRSVAKDTTRVGPDCMSVMLSPPPFGEIRVRYIPQFGEMGVLEGVRPQRVPIGFSPWVITPHRIMAPSTMTGHGMCLGTGLYEIRFLAPAAPPNDERWQGFAAISSQDRATPPEQGAGRTINPRRRGDQPPEC